MKKTCNKCNLRKSTDEFQPVKNTKDLLHGSCRACCAEYSRERYHSASRARAIQLAASITTVLRRKFPDTEITLSSADYADQLLTITECFYCGQPSVGTITFSLDHYQPLALGGKHELSNLVGCCEPCNRAKHDMPPEDYLRWLGGVRSRPEASRLRVRTAR